MTLPEGTNRTVPTGRGHILTALDRRRALQRGRIEVENKIVVAIQLEEFQRDRNQICTRLDNQIENGTGIIGDQVADGASGIRSCARTRA